MSDQKDYAEPRRDVAEESERRRLIAEAAYYEAERRGFTGDRTLDDWLAAQGGAAHDDATRQAENTEPNTREPATEPATELNEAVPARHQAAVETETIAPDQVGAWARRLKVSPTRLREAIGRIGSAVTDVKEYLQRGDTKRLPKR